MRLDVIKKELPVEKLKELRVGLVYLFGSYAEGVAGPGSDIDVGVVVTDKALVKGSITEIYNKLFDIFTDVFDMSDFKTIGSILLNKEADWTRKGSDDTLPRNLSIAQSEHLWCF